MQIAEDYKQHWDEKFQTREWGAYPPEDLIRFMKRNFGSQNPADVKVLEVGCGPGANLWFLYREGYQVFGIDGSPTAIEKTHKRLAQENTALNSQVPDLQVGDISSLPWGDSSYDLVIDIFAIYANTLKVIHKTASEIERVLKPGGLFYAKMWGKNTDGFGKGTTIENGTFDALPSGPCQEMGITHFFDEEEIRDIFSNFEIIALDRVVRTDTVRHQDPIEEYHCQFRKKG